MVDKTRSSSMAEDTAVSFAKHMDNYIKNSEAIVAAVQAAALPLRKGQKKGLKDELATLKSELDEVKAIANNNEQYSRSNSIRILGLIMSEEEGEDCYDNVLDLCENVLEIEVGRVELDRVHRVGKPREAVEGSERPPPPRPMTVKLKGYDTKIKFIKAHRCLSGKNIYINKDLTKDTHDFLLKIKKDCVEGVAVYIVDGCVLIWPVSRTQERFIVL